MLPSSSRSCIAKVVLKSKIDGRPSPAAFAVITEDFALGDLKDGEAILRLVYASLEPFMQAQSLNDANVGDTIEARSLAVVHSSRSEALKVGDVVWGFFGLQAFVRLSPSLKDLRGYGVLHNKISIARWPSSAPLSWSLSILGLTGLTAWSGLVKVGRLKAGEVVFISGAAGAIGLIAGQIAKALGCYVVGSASTDEKCRIARSICFDECFNYQKAIGSSPMRSSQPTHGIAQAISEHCSRGVDVFFDSVGGPMIDAACITAKPRGRIVVCGAISEQFRKDREPRYAVRFLPIMIEKMLELKGFTVFDYYPAKMEEYLSQMQRWISEGKVSQYEEHVVDGIEHSPEAFCRMLQGAYIGKTLVKMSDDSFASGWTADPCRHERESHLSTQNDRQLTNGNGKCSPASLLASLDERTREDSKTLVGDAPSTTADSSPEDILHLSIDQRVERRNSRQICSTFDVSRPEKSTGESNGEIDPGRVVETGPLLARRQDDEVHTRRRRDFEECQSPSQTFALLLKDLQGGSMFKDSKTLLGDTLSTAMGEAQSPQDVATLELTLKAESQSEKELDIHSLDWLPAHRMDRNSGILGSWSYKDGAFSIHEAVNTLRLLFTQDDFAGELEHINDWLQVYIPRAKCSIRMQLDRTGNYLRVQFRRDDEARWHREVRAEKKN